MWRYLLLLPVYLLVMTLPLLSTVGANLEYEYALLASYLALVLIPAAGAALPPRFLPVETSGAYSPPFAFEIFWIFLISPALALIPGGALYLTKLCPCSIAGFGFWMLVAWYPAWVLAHAALHGVMRARAHGLPRWLPLTALATAYAAVAILGLSSLWFEPQKRLVNLVTSFLHGPIYDDWIAVDTGILLARGAHLAVATVLLLLVWYRRRFALIAGLTGAAALWIGTGVLAGDFHSIKNEKSDLDALLFGKLEGGGFTLHYRPAGNAAPSAANTPLKVQRLFRDTEFHVGELTKLLGADGTPLPHVEVYVYPDDDRKKLWFGGGSTDVTDVRTPSIHISATSWPHPTLRHELVHALSSGFGYHGIGFHPNMAFTEGLAVALAPSPGSLTLDEGAAELLHSGRLPDVDALFSPASFWQVAGGRAYTVAGSFLRFLITNHGIKGVKELYSGKSWDEAFGEPRDALVKEWEDGILAKTDKEKNALFAEALFRYPGVLGDVCPHSKADLSRARNDSVFTRTRQPVGWDPEADYLTWLLHLDPKDQETRLKVWKREIRRIAQDRFPPLGRLSTWRDALAHGRASPPKTLEDVEMGIAESDVARVVGDTEGSIAILKELAGESAKHAFGDSVTREIQARLAIEATPNPRESLEWRRYLAGWRRTLPDGNVMNGPWVLSYLKLRNDRDTKLGTAELVRIMADLPPDGQLPATFHTEWYRLIGNRLMLLGSFKDAATAFGKASAAAKMPTREVFEEHARRAAFYAEKGPLMAVPETADEDDGKASH